MDKALGIIQALSEAGFIVDVSSEIISTLQAKRSEQQSLVLNADARAAEVDAKFRERGLVLFPFQKMGIKWLASRTGALLADEMGLGKTIQAVVAFPLNAPVLVVCPAVAKGVWAREIARWRPDLKPVVLSGRNSLVEWPKPGQVLITNYDILPDVPAPTFPPTPKPKVAPWTSAPVPGTVLVGDEAHALKSSRTKRTISFREIARVVFEAQGRVWLITGTPLLNKPPELWAVLQAADIAREAFTSWNLFVEDFGGTPGEWGGFEWGTPRDTVPGKLRRVCLRRMRDDVLPELPVKTWQQVPIELNKATRLRVDKETKALTACMPTAWDRLLSDDDPFEGNKEPDNDLSVAVEEARQWVAATHGTNFEAISNGRSLLAKAKIPALIEMVENFEEQDEPLVVFSAYRAPIDIFADRTGWAVITGDTPPGERTRIEDDFQAGKLKGVAGTIKAAGVAITLTRAHHVIFVDREFTPGLNAQAEDRVCRISQTRGVIIHDLVANHPLDKLLYEILCKKETIISASVDAAKVDDRADPVQIPDVDFDALTRAAKEEAKAADKADRLARARRAKVENERLAYEAERAKAQKEGRVVHKAFLSPGRRAPANRRELWALQALITLNRLDPDMARTRNDVGFNGRDSGFGHHLGERLYDGLTDKEWEAACALCTKYWRQVGRPPEAT
jgi:SWI/SNF-related matrix-associated actin-dependent regulator of chromatin subfamily A-like protein 1